MKFEKHDLQLHQEAYTIVSELEKGKTKDGRAVVAYFIGGPVRDLSMGNMPGDWDIGTNASYEESQDLLQGIASSFHTGGKSYKVLFVSMPSTNAFEVATFRKETYNKPFKPDVEEVKSLKEDVLRRDFTCNGLAMEKDGTVLDYVGGLADIDQKLLRFIGNGDERIAEDPSRILRAFEQSSRLGFVIEKGTAEALRRNIHQLSLVPKERVGKAIQKAIEKQSLAGFLEKTLEYGALPYVLPELMTLVGAMQNPKYHRREWDAFAHTVGVVRYTEKHYPGDIVMNLKAILHDNKKGDPSVRTMNMKDPENPQPQDKNHEEEGAKPAYDCVMRLGFGKSIAEEVMFGVRYHGIPLTSFDPNQSAEEEVKKVRVRTIRNVLKKLAAECTSKEQLRHRVQRLFAFKKADASAFQPDFGAKQTAIVDLMLPKYLEVLSDYAFYPADLEVNGDDLKKAGVPDGKAIKEMLDELIQQNLCQREAALAYVQKKQKRKDT